MAIDAAPLLDPQTGVGRYVRELSHALEAQGVQLRRYAVSFTGRGSDSIARWKVPARLVQEAWVRTGFPRIDPLLRDADVVHGTNFVLPPLGERKGIVTIHDLGFRRADTFPGGHRLNELVPWSLRRAGSVITPTHAIAGEVADAYRFPHDRVHVTHLGVSPTFFSSTPLSEVALARMGIHPPFVLAVATLQPRKNLFRLLEAWRRLGRGLSDWSLVVAGPKGWGPELPPVERVVPIGWVGDETLPGLLRAAEVFCYPSLYEGFGLPPLEAMAAGRAVLAGRYSCAAEVLGDAVLQVDPEDVDAIAGGLERLLGDAAERRRLGVAGRARAAGFTWSATASATIEAYRQLREGR